MFTQKCPLRQCSHKDSVEIVSVLCVSVHTTRTVLKSLMSFMSVFTQKCPLCQCSHKDSVEIVSVLCVSVHITWTVWKSSVSFALVFTQHGQCGNRQRPLR